MRQTYQLFQEEKEKSIILQSLQKDEEKNQNELQLVLKLETENNQRAEKLKLLSEKIEKERYILFHSKFYDFTNKFDRSMPYKTFQTFKEFRNNQSKSIYRNTSNDYLESESYNNNSTSQYQIKSKSYHNQQLEPTKLPKNIKYKINNETSKILYDEKIKRIEDLQSKLALIKSIKKEYKIAQTKRNEAAKSLSFLIEKKKQFLYESFSESNYQSHFDSIKKSQFSTSQKLLQSRIQQIQNKEKILLMKKDNYHRMLEVVERKNLDVIEKEKNVILLEQQILVVRKKYDEIVFQSQKELDFFDFYSSLKTGSGLSFNSGYQNEFKQIIKKNSEYS